MATQDSSSEISRDESEKEHESGQDIADRVEEASNESDSENSYRETDEQAASISFGALAKAQEILGKRKRTSDHDNGTGAPKASGKAKDTGEYVDLEALERKAGKRDLRDFSRASKHAPTELSSKKAVSRKRSVVPTKKIDHRDPRFEPVSGIIDEQKLKKNYSFLETYRDSEMAELRAAIRRTKDLETKDKLKRALLGMESRKKAQEMKDQQQEVLRKHRKEEKEKIEKGKKPFYLKKADQKKLALVERFEGMKGRQVDKVIERRRKKQSTKDRRTIPQERRNREE
ncbi:ribosomal RNA-processing protein 36, partial [Lecanoromycetidae sp. Uapishka_2]